MTEEIDVLCHMFVIPTIGKDWLFLARELFPSINQADKAIHDIACGHGNLEEKARCVITRWQHECGQEACKNVLLCALSHMPRNDIIQRLNAGKCPLIYFLINVIWINDIILIHE